MEKGGESFIQIQTMGKVKDAGCDSGIVGNFNKIKNGKNVLYESNNKLNAKTCSVHYALRLLLFVL